MPNHSNARIVVKAFARPLLKLTNGLKLALCLSIIIGFSGAALGQSPEPDWRVGWRSTIEAAQKERKVVVSIPASAELRQALEEGFKRQFPGISQELFPAQGASNINRILEEDKGGVHYFDVHIGGTSCVRHECACGAFPLVDLLPSADSARCQRTARALRCPSCCLPHI